MEPRNYIANARIEKILFGHELKNGDRVLIEDSLFRGDPNSAVATLRDRAMICNRWCQVTRLEKKNGLVKFIGLYDNGDMTVRDYSATTAWIVKL
jgi:hypothetical protein